MRQKSLSQTSAAEKTIKDIRRATRKLHSSEEKIRIVLEGLRGEDSIAAICRREGIAESLYYSWSKEFLEAGKKRLAGDTARSATSDEVKALRRESRNLKEALADLTLERVAQHDIDWFAVDIGAERPDARSGFEEGFVVLDVREASHQRPATVGDKCLAASDLRFDRSFTRFARSPSV